MSMMVVNINVQPESEYPEDGPSQAWTPRQIAETLGELDAEDLQDVIASLMAMYELKVGQPWKDPDV